MAKVQLANVAVLDNPSPFLNPFQFEVTFECIEELKEGSSFDSLSVSPTATVNSCQQWLEEVHFRMHLAVC